MYGLMDFIVILLILVIVFGAKWIPAAGEAIGRAMARRLPPSPAVRPQPEASPPGPPAPEEGAPK